MLESLILFHGELSTQCRVLCLEGNVFEYHTCTESENLLCTDIWKTIPAQTVLYLLKSGKLRQIIYQYSASDQKSSTKNE